MTAFRDAYLAGYRAAIHDAENEVRMLGGDSHKDNRENRVLLLARRAVLALANDPDVPEEKP